VDLELQQQLRGDTLYPKWDYRIIVSHLGDHLLTLGGNPRPSSGFMSTSKTAESLGDATG
jgi:hypothetical protein